MDSLFFLQLILLLLPGISIATPAQPINALFSSAPAANTSNAIAVGAVDPRFRIRSAYTRTPLNEDPCLVVAIQAMGIWSTLPAGLLLIDSAYSDDRFRDIYIATRDPPNLGGIPAQFLTWGTYLAVKDMIEEHGFFKGSFIFSWRDQEVGQLFITNQRPRLSLPGESSSNSLQQRSSTDPLTLVTSASLTHNSSNSSVPDTLSDQNSNFQMHIVRLGQSVPKFDVIMTLFEGLLSMAPHASSTRVSDVIRVKSPLPYEARVEIRPRRMPSPDSPYLTLGYAALALRDIPHQLLLQRHQWAEVSFNILFDDVIVGSGDLFKGRDG